MEGESIRVVVEYCACILCSCTLPQSEAQRLAAEVERLNALLSIKDTAYGKVLGDLDAAQAAMEGVKAQIRALQVRCREFADELPDVTVHLSCRKQPTTSLCLNLNSLTPGL